MVADRCPTGILSVRWRAGLASRHSDLGAASLLARAGIRPVPCPDDGIETVLRDSDALVHSVDECSKGAAVTLLLHGSESADAELLGSTPGLLIGLEGACPTVPTAETCVVGTGEPASPGSAADVLLEAAVRAVVPWLEGDKPGILAREGARLAASGAPVDTPAAAASPRSTVDGAAPEGGKLGFGPVSLMSAQVFLRGQLCRAFVNIKPVLPGHVLVAPARSVARVSSLTPAELADLFETARAAGALVQAAHRASALQLSVQDGPASGQSVPHVHVHVIPRRPGDLEAGDDVYSLLEASSGVIADAVRAGSRGDAAGLDAAWGGLSGLGRAGTATAAVDEAATQHTQLDDGDPSTGPRLRTASEMSEEAAWYLSLASSRSR